VGEPYMDGNQQKAVLWDMDGVLVDTGEFHFQTWSEVLHALNIPFDREVFTRTFGMNNHGVLSIVLGHPVDDAYVDEVGGRKEAAFRRAIVGRVQLMPGVCVWLERLQAKGYRQAVASSAPFENVEALVDALQIRFFFDTLVSAGNMPSKPDPAVFIEAARRVGVPPENCTVVEDAVTGVAAACRAGMRCLAVTNTNPREALSAADLVVDSLEDLPETFFE
jgi:beta-phosphoglucomutase